MPGGSGIELARALRASGSTVGLVLMTALRAAGAESAVTTAVGAKLLIEPITADRLAAEWLTQAPGQR
jgi:DNA-binding response OmpR family regulator